MTTRSRCDELEDVSDVLRFIDQRWASLTSNARHGHHDAVEDWKSMAACSSDGHLDDQDHNHPYILFLPNDFIFPGGRFKVQFYWDSYFIVLSLLRSGRIQLAKGMVDNLLFLVKRHGLAIPNRKRWAAGSQLPFLSHAVRAVYETTGDEGWLSSVVPLLEAEYYGYWLNAWHLSDLGLSRYHALPWFPQDALSAITMDAESSWDLSPRFDDADILDLLPVDLNGNLFTYERNFAFFAGQLGSPQKAIGWQGLAERRRAAIDELMWDSTVGLYFDYDVHHGRRKMVRSLAAYFPLYAGACDSRQAAKLVESLAYFESDFGLCTCDRDYGHSDRQWNYPIGWAPLHWIVAKGLLSYGYVEEARRVATKWLKLNHAVWAATGEMWEKYDVVKGSHKVLTDRYTNQTGFGWTNAVFHLLCLELREEAH